MAVKVLIESATLSTSGGSWRRGEASHFGLTHATASVDLRNTTVLLPVTFANSCNANGIFVIFSQSTYLYVTVKLQENVNGTWVDRASAVVDKTAESKSYYHGQYIAHTPYAVDTSANKWRYTFTGSTVAYYVYLVGSATNTPFYVVTGDADTTRPATGDVIVLANGVTLTMDESLSLGVDTLNSLVQGDQSVFQALPVASSALTLEATGWFPQLTRQSFLIGASDNPFTKEYPFTLSAKMAAAVFRSHNDVSNPTVENKIHFYGEQDSHINARIATSASSGQPNITTVVDMSAQWESGDKLYIAGADQLSAHVTEYTIQSISGTTITLTSNLGAKMLKGGSIVNVSRSAKLGIRIIAPSKIAMFSANSGGQYFAADSYKMFGTYLENVPFESPHDTATGGKFECKSILSKIAGTISGVWSNNYGAQGHTYENIHLVGTMSAYGLPAIYGTGLSFKNITIAISGTQSGGFMGNGFAIDGFVFGPGYNDATVYVTRFFGSGHTVNDVFCAGDNGVVLGCHASVFTNCSFQKGRVYGLHLVNGVGNKIINSGIGDLSAHGTADIYHVPNYFSQWHLQNTYVATIDDGYTKIVDGSWLRISHFNRTADDHRGWCRNGIFFSDTNRLAMRQTGANRLTTQYLIGTNDVTDLSVAILLNCKINSATYYAGTHALPKMVVDYDSGTLVTATAAASTAVQRLVAIFAPTTSNNIIAINLYTETDATGSAADVFFDSLVIRSRRYGKVFSDNIKYITEINADVIAEIATPDTDPFITQATEATVAAYTGIAIDHTNGLIAVTEDRSIQELYDYCKYHLALEANMDKGEFFTTIDGTIFTCAYNLTVDGATLAGEGKRLDLGTRTFTVVNGGATSATVTDASGTLVALTLTNVVVGSRCRIERVADGAALLSAVATDTTVVANYTHTADVVVRVRVRHASSSPKYLPWEGQGTVTAAGLSMIVSQIEDPIAEAA